MKRTRIEEMAKLIKAWLIRRKIKKDKRAQWLRIADLQLKHMRLCLSAGQEANVK